MTRAVAAAVGVGAVALAYLATREAPTATGVIRTVGVAIPVAFALVRLGYRRNDRFALLLLGAAVLQALSTLAEVDGSVAYSAGRVAAWTIEPAIVLVMLTFPLGRIERAVERRLVLAVALMMSVLYLPTAFVGSFPEPTPLASCGTDCPANAFLVTDHPLAVVDQWVRPIRELLAILLFAGVTAALAGRARRSAPISQRILGPIVTVAMLRVVALATFFVLRRAGESNALTDTLGWLYVLSLPIVTAAAAGGLLAHRLFVATALEQLTRTFANHPSAPELRDALAESLRDPSLEIRFWATATGGWIDEQGRQAELPARYPGRTVTEISSAGQPRAAIVHDSALAEDVSLLDAVSAYALTALENRQLIDELRTSLDELPSRSCGS